MYSPFHKFPAKKSATRKKNTSTKGRNSPKKHQPDRSPGERRSIQTLASAPLQPAKTSSTSAHARRNPQRHKNRKTTSLKAYRRKRLRLLRVFFVLCAAILLGFSLKWMAASGFTTLYARLRADVLQVTEKSRPLPFTQDAYLALTREIELYLQKQPGTFGVAGSDLVTGAQFGWQAHESFSAAQTLALPITVNLYSEIANGQLSAQTLVHVQSVDKQAGPGFIGGLPDGTPLSVTELARAALVDHDIVAINMLIRKLDPSEINSFMNSVGSHETLATPRLITPYDLTLYLSYLYSMNQAHPKTVAPLMQDLLQVAQANRIAGGLPSESKIEQVTGDWPNEFHDAAIFWIHQHPIALAICSEGVDEREASRVESHIARLVAQFVSQQ
ncbi:serine hydrolase [Sulfoacidibacillus thermotolerans]|uniref:Beta-lactamase class A catalytic domain-containing protein n=1 Tax=Sulfoacidibacillus thermotolerans TaxID=1765684 RepID=A0A2U3DCG2_SULT2|nr:serine hydrolase [Sulfoacidibacillus thermotolerans]PWI58974.1 hypothetical protein BM613_02570 [Sulfoacidibacillus thermotolerans]